jgi:hypothetical protein
MNLQFDKIKVKKWGVVVLRYQRPVYKTVL